LALASKGLFATGVSTDINISYISGVKQGETVTVEARVDKLGKTLAFTTVELFTKERLGNLVLMAKREDSLLSCYFFNSCIRSTQ
jgi:acyl-coenzyme A thioesterase PaaI-like protein